MQKKRILYLLICFLFCSLSIYAQDREVRGTITDTNGETLMGVTVTVKGSKGVGTITDLDGNFVLKVPSSAKKLEATYIGMKTTDAEITGNVVNIVMNEMNSELDELVVIGYATVKRRDLTGPVSSVQGDALKNIPVANVAEAMAGKMAGVHVTTTEGSPDAEMIIRVRGGGSLTGNSTPLFIVDGFPVESISDIPPSEIESIDVLKDGSTTAIYGARGANGVVILTTKSGKSGQMSISYNTFYGVRKIKKTLDVLAPRDYAKWQYELALLKDGKGNAESYEKYFGTYQDIDMYDNYKGNDWQDLVFGRTGHVYSQNLSISGGADKFTYMFSYAHIGDKAIMESSDYSRDNISLKLKHSPFKSLTFDYSIRFSNTKVNGSGMNEQNEKSSGDSRLRHTVIYSPIPIKGFGDNGEDTEETSSDLVNPFTAVADNAQLSRKRVLNMSGGITWKGVKNLTVKSDIGVDYFDTNNNRFYGSSTYYASNTPPSAYLGLPSAVFTTDARRRIRNTNTVNYDFKKFIKSKDHSFSMLLGEETLVTTKTVKTNTANGFPSFFTSSDAFYRTGQAKHGSLETNVSRDDKLFSFFGRANYDYKSKYLLTGTLRSDGSSKFARGNRWSYFPSAAVAWRISGEDFMTKTQSWMDNLKLRLGYGTAGNDNIDAGQMLQTFTSSATQWIDGINNYWSASKYMANPDLKWETTHTRNVGLDFGFLNSKLNGSVDFYLNTTKDLLMLFPVTGTGYDAQFRNIGSTQNKGVEIQLNYTAIDKKNFGLDFGFNISFNKNKIKDMGILEDYAEKSGWNSAILADYWVGSGSPVGQMYGYVSDGRYEVSDFKEYDGSKWELKDGVTNSSEVVGTLRPGSMKLKNVNESADNLVNADDRKIIGDANPVHTGGFTANARIYNFDISAIFNWSYGNDIYNANKLEFSSTGKYQYRNLSTEMEDGRRWTNLMPDGTITNDANELIALNQNTTMWSPYMKDLSFVSWGVEDGSFLRLSNLTVGYTLPSHLLQKVKVKSLRFYASAYNVFCWTNYSGLDPEVSTRRKTALTPGVDYSPYPKSRQFVFGLNLNF